MITRIIFQTFVLLLVCNNYSLAQGLPPPAMPKEENKTLIDKIIAISHYKRYFESYCTKKVKAFAKENNWNNTKIETVLSRIKFDNYSYTIYNSYAFYSKEQLNKILEVVELINKNSKQHSTMILTNLMMQSNLDLYIKGLLEDKY